MLKKIPIMQRMLHILFLLRFSYSFNYNIILNVIKIYIVITEN